ncbi:hypothetical protein LguiA_035551 [Lonicera macranthoides]
MGIVTYNILLKGLCQAGKCDHALHLWHLMLQRGLSPNEVGYGTLIDGLFKKGDCDGAFKLWKHYLAKGFHRSNIVFNTMLNGLCKGKMVEAKQIFGKMRELGFFFLF